MADDMMEVVQMMRFSFDGLRLGVDVTGATVKEAKNMAIFIVGLLHREKLSGKTTLKNMLKKDGNLQVLQIKESDLKEVERKAKKYGILYSKLPDINSKDGMTEILFPMEATARINTIIKDIEDKKIESISDYVKNGEDGKYEETLKFLKENNVLNDKPPKVEKKRAEELMNVTKNINYNAAINDMNNIDISISKELVVGEDGKSFKTRVPGTYGENIRFLNVSKEDVLTYNNGKTFLTFLKKDQEYELMDKDGNVAEKIKGETLRKNSYSRVSDETRQRAIDQERKSKERIQKKKREQQKQRKEQNAKQKAKVKENEKKR